MRSQQLEIVPVDTGNISPVIQCRLDYNDQMKDSHKYDRELSIMPRQLESPIGFYNMSDDKDNTRPSKSFKLLNPSQQPY